MEIDFYRDFAKVVVLQKKIPTEFSANLCEDRQVQRLMDDLDLPKDRANLFEALDADSSGALHLAELAQGLLKVRGELKKLSLCSWDFRQGRKV